MPEINSDTDDPKEVKKKAAKRMKKLKKLKKEDATYGYDKKGNSLNPKDIAKAKKKKAKPK